MPYEDVYGSGFEDPHDRLPAVDRLDQTIGGFAPSWTLDATLQELIAIEQSADPDPTISPENAA